MTSLHEAVVVRTAGRLPAPVSRQRFTSLWMVPAPLRVRGRNGPGTGHQCRHGITTDGEVLFVTPVRDDARRQNVREAIEEANRRYGGMLRKLAES